MATIRRAAGRGRTATSRSASKDRPSSNLKHTVTRSRSVLGQTFHGSLAAAPIDISAMSISDYEVLIAPCQAFVDFLLGPDPGLDRLVAPDGTPSAV